MKIYSNLQQSVQARHNILCRGRLTLNEITWTRARLICPTPKISTENIEPYKQYFVNCDAGVHGTIRQRYQERHRRILLLHSSSTQRHLYRVTGYSGYRSHMSSKLKAIQAAGYLEVNTQRMCSLHYMLGMIFSKSQKVNTIACKRWWLNGLRGPAGLIDKQRTHSIAGYQISPIVDSIVERTCRGQRRAQDLGFLAMALIKSPSCGPRQHA